MRSQNVVVNATQNATQTATSPKSDIDLRHDLFVATSYQSQERPQNPLFSFFAGEVGVEVYFKLLSIGVCVSVCLSVCLFVCLSVPLSV